MLIVDDIITPDKFISLSHICLSERRNSDLNLSPLKNIFFVKTDFLPRFISTILPSINFRFKLITHDADLPITNDYKIILDNPFLIKWYGMNCHVVHSKLQSLPIGVANECWPHGDKQALLDVANSAGSKQHLVYSNFQKSTNLNERQNVNSNIKELKGLFIEAESLSYKTYLQKLSTYKFCISPPGNSVDCHRVWESLYVGTIPIVLKSIPMVYWKDCPILFINEWKDLLKMNLEEKYLLLKQKNNNKSKFSYYRKLIYEDS